MSLVHKGDHNWSGFQAKETTRKPTVPREQAAAQSLLGTSQSRGVGEKKASVAFLRRDILGLLFVPRGELVLPECSSQKLVLCRFGDRP